VIADGDGGCRDYVAPKLVREVGDVMQIERRADEEMIGQRDLQAGSEVKLKMSGTADGGGWGGTHGGAGAAALRDDEAGAGAAQSALQLYDGAFSDEWLIDPIHIDEGLAVLKRAVVPMSGLKVNFGADAEMLAEHDVASESQEEAIQLGRGLTGRYGIRHAGIEGGVIDAEARGGIPGTAKIHVYVQGALRVRESGEEE